MFATVSGGVSNTAGWFCDVVGGGGSNDASAGNATVSGGSSNTASGGAATVSGGWHNIASGNLATVGGGAYNQANAAYATIAGGGPSDMADASTTRNLVTDDFGTIGGGGWNHAGDNAGTTTDASYATVAGGYNNIAGGRCSGIGGGAGNTASAIYATVGGGAYSEASGVESTISGGYSNTASADDATVGGGASNAASAIYATVSGGYGNTASGSYATVAGGLSNHASGAYSFAAGHNAKANHEGAFVWADSQFADIASTAEDQVTFRCLGGVRLTSGSAGSNQEVSWAPGSSSWSFSSDKNLKENFVEIDPKEVLERISHVSITEWNFKGYSQRHIGPAAQDFHALFPLGGSDTMIDSGDLQGVSLAAIQGLHEIVREKESRISTLEQRNADLETRLEALEALVVKLTNGKDTRKNAE